MKTKKKTDKKVSRKRASKVTSNLGRAIKRAFNHGDAVTMDTARFRGNQHGSKLKVTVKRKDGKTEQLQFSAGTPRVTGLAAPLESYQGATHDQLKGVMTRIIVGSNPPTEKLYFSQADDPERPSHARCSGSAPGAYTRPVKW